MKAPCLGQQIAARFKELGLPSLNAPCFMCPDKADAFIRGHVLVVLDQGDGYHLVSLVNPATGEEWDAPLLIVE